MESKTKYPERDIGLDYIRALALILMVSIHYWRLIPDVSKSVEMLKFIGESAPAFFFFAFGMTMDKFFEKDHNTRLVRLTSFLYISLIHNIFVAKTFVTGFFFILWAIQALFYIMHTILKKPARWHCIILLTTTLFMFILPFQKVSSFFSLLIPGHFPILPWGLFVIAGYIFSKYRERTDSLNFILPFILISIAAGCLLLNYYYPGYKNFGIRKWPMSAPYFILFSGISILFVNCTNQYKAQLFQISFIYQPILFISKHLLFAVVISYLSSAPFMKILTLFFTTDFIIEHALFFLITGAIICMFIQLVLMKGVLYLWNAYNKLRISSWLYDHFDMIAIVSIITCSAGMGITRYTLQGPGSYLFGHDSLITASRVIESYDIWLLTCLFLMLFFGLIMTERRLSSVAHPVKIKKKYITITIVLFLIAFSTRLYPAFAEDFFLMQSPYKDHVPQKIKQLSVNDFRNKNVLLSHLKPISEPYIFKNGVNIFPYRCIIRKMGDETVAIDSVILFSFLQHQNNSSFIGAKLVSYKSFKSDLTTGGRLLVKKELLKLLSND